MNLVYPEHGVVVPDNQGVCNSKVTKHCFMSYVKWYKNRGKSKSPSLRNESVPDSSDSFLLPQEKLRVGFPDGPSG